MGTMLTLESNPADYHLFKEGELEELVDSSAAGFAKSFHAHGCAVRQVRVVKQCVGWEKGNWWGIWNVYEHPS